LQDIYVNTITERVWILSSSRAKGDDGRMDEAAINDVKLLNVVAALPVQTPPPGWGLKPMQEFVKHLTVQ